MIKGRRAFSKGDINDLMLGRYNAAKVPDIGFMKENGLSSKIRLLNRERNTMFSPEQFFNKSDLIDIKYKWDAIPLGLTNKELEDEIGKPFLKRRDDIKEQSLEYRDKLLDQKKEDKERIDREKKMFEENREKLQNQKSSVPINTPPLETEIFTASRVYPTNSGSGGGSTVDQTTGLTGTQTALLSPEEQEIAKRQNQGIGSLT